MGRPMTSEEKEKTKKTYLVLLVLSIIASIIGVCNLYPITSTIDLIIKVIVTTVAVLGLWFLAGLLLLIWFAYIIGNSNKY